MKLCDHCHKEAHKEGRWHYYYREFNSKQQPQCYFKYIGIDEQAKRAAKPLRVYFRYVYGF